MQTYEYYQIADLIRNRMSYENIIKELQITEEKFYEFINEREKKREKRREYNMEYMRKKFSNCPDNLLNFALAIDRFKKKKQSPYPTKDFDYKDVMKKFGEKPVCYLSGLELTYQTSSPDHVLPPSLGGTNELDNLQLCRFDFNLMKGMFRKDEFISLCKLVSNFHK